MNRLVAHQRVVNVKNEVISLLQNLKNGWMPGISYDTAWIASHSLMFPKSLNWILSNQRDDGSWGCDVEYHHDRLISTLASIVTLSKSHKSDRFKRQIEKGEEYLWQTLNEVKKEQYSTIGFELLFPALMEEAERLHLNAPHVGDEYFEKIRESKLSVILKDLIYSGKTTLSFSAEFLGQDLDVTRTESMQNPNGSVGNSPSATAYLLHNVLERRALAYLDELTMLNSDGSIMAVYPFEVFEKSWVIYHFIVLGLPIEEYCAKHVSDLKRAWTKKGTGISRTSPVLDSDDTALAFRVLTHMGEKLSPEVFNNYEGERNFACFKYERDPSVSANIHILDAIKNDSSYNDRELSIEKILKFLKSKRASDGYWTDKWHVSPYYATGHAIIALSGLDDSMAGESVEWIIDSQNSNGSWGVYRETLEETAYALWALLYYYENVEKIDEKIILKGIQYLSKNFNSEDYPGLWIAKGLYCPLNVVKSVVLSVLYKSSLMRLAQPELTISVLAGPVTAERGGVKQSHGGR